MKNKRNLKKGFSLGELIISMSLIILLTGVGIMACHLSLSGRKNREENLMIWSMVDSVEDAFDNALLSAENMKLEGNISQKNRTRFDFIFENFNNELAFICNIQNFSTTFAGQVDIGNPKDPLKGESWKMLIDKTGDYINSNDEYDITKIPNLTIEHYHKSSRYNPFWFTYTYEQPKYKIVFDVFVLGDTYYYKIFGYRHSNSRALCTIKGEYSYYEH